MPDRSPGRTVRGRTTTCSLASSARHALAGPIWPGWSDPSTRSRTAWQHRSRHYSSWRLKRYMLFIIIFPHASEIFRCLPASIVQTCKDLHSLNISPLQKQRDQYFQMKNKMQTGYTLCKINEKIWIFDRMSTIVHYVCLLCISFFILLVEALKEIR